jgi:hypothetical protein
MDKQEVINICKILVRGTSSKVLFLRRRFEVNIKMDFTDVYLW